MQVVLKNILIESQMMEQMMMDVTEYEERQGLSDLLKYSTIVIGSLPMLILYTGSGDVAGSSRLREHLCRDPEPGPDRRGKLCRRRLLYLLPPVPTIRASFWTGRYPHETNVLSNGRKWAVRGIPVGMTTLGETFAKAGWETAHFGKTYDAEALRGFTCEPEGQIVTTPENPAYPENRDTFHDNYTVRALCRYLEEREDPRNLR